MTVIVVSKPSGICCNECFRRQQLVASGCPCCGHVIACLFLLCWVGQISSFLSLFVQYCSLLIMCAFVTYVLRIVSFSRLISLPFFCCLRGILRVLFCSTFYFAAGFNLSHAAFLADVAPAPERAG